MKIADALKVSASGIDFTAQSCGENSVEVSASGKEFFKLGRINVAGFGGELSLPEKLRCHRTHDNLCVEFDSVNVIPFGCEYRVKRHWTLFSNIALLNCDIAADNGGMVRDLELEPIEIMLTPAKVEFLIRGEDALRTVENASGELYSGSSPVLMFRVSDAEGKQMEYVCGDDFWRHCAAEKIAGASANYTITVEENKTILKRQILITPEEVCMEKRPWKFKSIFAWKDGNTAPASADQIESLDIPGCFASSFAHREIRKFVRSAQSGKTLVINGEFPVFCTDPAHLERPAKTPVEHSDLGAAALDYLWANRELAKRDSVLVMKSTSRIYGDSVVLKNLAEMATLFDEEE